MKTDERRGLWRRAGGRLLDLLYPPHCALCQCRLSDSRWLCPDCADALPRIGEPFCRRCGEPFEGVIEDSFLCPNCGNLKFAFEFARPALRSHPALRSLILDLKYRRQIHLAAELGRLALESLEDDRLAPALAGRWPVVPVPLHWKRLQKRHFNQSAEIARVFARSAGLPLVAALRRIRDTGTQTRLSRKERLTNLRDAFRLSRAGRRLVRERAPGAIVFDDVFTTGSTTHECARTLRRAGVEKVVVITVMRG
jgi:ComF family protein